MTLAHDALTTPASEHASSRHNELAVVVGIAGVAALVALIVW